MGKGRLLGMLTATPLILLSLSAGCGTSSSGSTIGFFPTEMTGNAYQVIDCAGLGLAEGDEVLISLTGNRITVKTDSEFDLDCRGTIFGAGDMTFADAVEPQVQNMDFEITAKDDCYDLDDVDYTDLGKVAVTFETMPPQAPLTCTDASDSPLGDRLECAIEGCTFIVLDPLIVYKFDLEEALEEAIYDALY
jgi:hypothetical protein